MANSGGEQRQQTIWMGLRTKLAAKLGQGRGVRRER